MASRPEEDRKPAVKAIHDMRDDATTTATAVNDKRFSRRAVAESRGPRIAVRSAVAEATILVNTSPSTVGVLVFSSCS